MSIENPEIQDLHAVEVIDSESGKNLSRKPYFIAIIIEIILLYFVNNFLHNSITGLAPYVTSTYPSFIVKTINAMASFKVPFLTAEFNSCLWAINLAITVALLGNLALTLYHPRWFHHLLKGLLLGLAVLPAYVIFHLFPFELDSQMHQTLIRIALIVIMAGLALGFIYQMAMFVIYYRKKIKIDREKKQQAFIASLVVPVSTEPSQPQSSEHLGSTPPDQHLENKN
jgi:hypothetical protein